MAAPAITMVRPPSHRQRRVTRKLARLERAHRLPQRREGRAMSDSSNSADTYGWYIAYLADNYPPALGYH